MYLSGGQAPLRGPGFSCRCRPDAGLVGDTATTETTSGTASEFRGTASRARLVKAPRASAAKAAGDGVDDGGQVGVLDHVVGTEQQRLHTLACGTIVVKLRVEGDGREQGDGTFDELLDRVAVMRTREDIEAMLLGHSLDQRDSSLSLANLRHAANTTRPVHL